MKTAVLPSLAGRRAGIAILRASRIGDFVCATPALRAVRQAAPDAQITFIGLPFLRPLAQRSPSIDHFLPFPGFPGIADQFFEAGRALRFLNRMQAQRFDLAIQLHGSGLYSNSFALLLGAARTAGFVRFPGEAFDGLDPSCPFPQEGRESERLLRLAHLLGAGDVGDDAEFPLWPEDLAAAGRLLAGAPRPLVGVHAGGREADKRRDGSALLRAARAVATNGGGVVLLGGSRGAAPSSPANPTVIDLRGRTSLPVLGAVIQRLALLIANDSAPAHIARALDTPTVTRFLATDPARWGPKPGDARHQVVSAAELAPDEQVERLALAARLALQHA